MGVREPEKDPHPRFPQHWTLGHHHVNLLQTRPNTEVSAGTPTDPPPIRTKSDSLGFQYIPVPVLGRLGSVATPATQERSG